MKSIYRSMIIVAVVLIAVSMLVSSLDFSSKGVNAGSSEGQGSPIFTGFSLRFPSDGGHVQPPESYSSGPVYQSQDGTVNNGIDVWIWKGWHFNISRWVGNWYSSIIFHMPSWLLTFLSDGQPNGGTTANTAQGNAVNDSATTTDPSSGAQGLNDFFLILIVTVASILIIMTAFFVIRKYRAKNKGKMNNDTPSDMVAAIDRVSAVEGFYKMRFPQIKDPFPLTWGDREPLSLAISSKDRTSGEVTIVVDGTDVAMVKLDQGEALATLTLNKGRHRISVKGGIEGREASWTDICIVDYKEEVVRLFNEMYGHFKAGSESVCDEMTPRELEQAVSEQLPVIKRRMLDTAVTVFEFANYSTHTIRRSEYEKMYLSKAGVT